MRRGWGIKREQSPCKVRGSGVCFCTDKDAGGGGKGVVGEAGCRSPGVGTGAACEDLKADQREVQRSRHMQSD